MAIVTAADVLGLTGATVTDAQILQAQGIVELVTGYDLSRATLPDALVGWPRDQRKIRKAVGYQAAFISAHPDVFTVADTTTSSADGASQTYRDFGQALAPLAKIALRKLSKNRSRSVHVAGPNDLFGPHSLGDHASRRHGHFTSWDGPAVPEGVGSGPYWNGVAGVPEGSDAYDNWGPL